ncbi:MAG: Atxe2 family lasso peptide isopeptidase [Gammaproteobacteria bacterium]
MSALRRCGLVLLLAACGLGWDAPNAQAESCADLVPPAARVISSTRDFVAEDLVSLRDIGPRYAVEVTLPILALSPDRSSVAFQLRRAKPGANTTCLGMFVMELTPGAMPVSVDRGGELVGSASDTDSPTAPGRAVTPKWSPDGTSIAFLRRDRGTTQLWKARIDGTGSAAVTHEPFDIVDFGWSPDGRALFYSGRPASIAAREALDREGDAGFLYDDRMIPLVGSRPRLPAALPEEYFVVEQGAMLARRTGTDETALAASILKPAAPLHALRVARAGLQRIGWITTRDTSSPLSLTALHAKQGRGAEQLCEEPVCDRVRDLWWAPDGSALFYLRREGWALSQLGLYRWTPGHGHPRRILVTEDALLGCQMATKSLVCAHEASAQPRRLVSIDLATGRMTLLFDPNPEVAGLRFGTIERLRWKNDIGIETFGDLVLPPDHRPGERHPLVVVGYESVGFLRGGTGDDYPIPLFATRGYAVLSFQRPLDYGVVKGARSIAELEHMNRVNWADRRSVLSALEGGVRLSESRGVVDSRRVGLTGFSDGAATAQFAMLNSESFAVIAVSNCCDDAVGNMTLLGPHLARSAHAMGYPELTEDGSAFWAAYSLTANARAVRTPLLIQIPDSEYLIALPTYMALTEQKKPVEMRVFPDETHVRWQPAHRLAIYDRSLDWFDFWLRGKEDAAVAKVDQYARWRAMRDAQCLAEAVATAPVYCANPMQ